MARVVVILGAGASADAGVPTMGNFFVRAEALLRDAKSPITDRPAFQRTLTLVGELQRLLAKTKVDLENLEVVLGLVEMGVILRSLLGMTEEQVGKSRNDLLFVIHETIESSLRLKVINRRAVPPPAYTRLVEIATTRSSSGGPHSGDVAFITLNYDIGLDAALATQGIPFTYGLDVQAGDGVRLLKLHGSTNWFFCPSCKKVLAEGVPGNYMPLSPSAEFVVWKLRNHMPKHPHCGEQPREAPVIVPPTWNKSLYREAVQNVWCHAAQELRTAERILIIGYSLPATDEFFRYLMAIGIEGPSRIKQVRIMDVSGNVFGKFQALLGPALESRSDSHVGAFKDSVESAQQVFLA